MPLLIVCLLAGLPFLADPSLAREAGAPGGDRAPTMEFKSNRPVVLEADPAHKGTSVAEPAAPATATDTPAATATFQVTYDSGFTEEARKAFQAAVDIWSRLVTSPVTIKVNATFQPAKESVNLGSATATSSVRNFANAPYTGTFYPITLAEALAGTDLNNGAFDISANFNSNRTDWYFGTDGAVPAGQYDFESVVLHELGHGLGFSGSAYVTGTGAGGWGVSNGDDTGEVSPMIYDRFTQDKDSRYVISSSSYTNGSFALGSALTSGKLYFFGSKSYAENVHARPQLYAPSTWKSGSSYSHLDETQYSAGNANSLMTPYLGGAESVHAPGPLALCMLEDMGWTTSEDCAAPPRPANDNFSAAQALSGIEGSATGTNLGASREPGEPDLATNTPASHSVWYRWTPPLSGEARFELCGSSYNTAMALYTGTAVNALTRVAAGKVSDCLPQSIRVFQAVAGTTYRIAVDGYADAMGTISLRWSMKLPPPFNDAFSSSTGSFPGGTLTAQGTTYGATKEAGEPNHAGNSGGHSIWYGWTAQQSGTALVDTCGSGFDTLLAVYTGTSVGALTEVAADDDDGFCGSGSKQSFLSFTAVAGRHYGIAIDGYGGSQGPTVLHFKLVVPPPPANDHLENATAISGTTGSINGTTLSATKQAGEPNHAGQTGGRSIWYRWTAPSAGTVLFDTCLSGFNTLLAAYTGTLVSTLTPVASNDDSAICAVGSNRSRIQFPAVGGVTYRIAVDGAAGDLGTSTLRWSLNVTPPPANDNFLSAQALGPGGGTVGGSNVNASKQAGEPNHAGNTGGRSIWYTFKANGTGPVTVDTCGSTFDTLLAVYTGSAVNALTSVTWADDSAACGGTGRQSQVTFTPISDATYAIAVDGYYGANGQVSLRWLQRPANDPFAKAEAVSGSGGTRAGDSTRATKENFEPHHAGSVGGRSVWYRWPAPSTGRVTFDTCGTGFDTLLAVYTGSSVGGLTPVASDDDSATCGTGQLSRVTFVPSTGTTYYVAVDGYAGAGGALTLNWAQAPRNDDFAAADLLSGSASSVSGTNVNATAEPGEPSHAGLAARSVWYRWTAAASGPVAFDTCGSGFDTRLAAYTGASLTALTKLDGSDDATCDGVATWQSRITFNAVAGTTYRVAVDGYNGASGPLSLHWVLRPANDDFTAGQVLPGTTSGSVSGSSVNATKEPGEPAHAAGNAGGRSIWYRWTPASSGVITFETCGSGFDTLLGVYEGTGVTSLVRVAGDDDGCGTNMTSKVTFAVTAGRTYRIAVDGFDGSFGTTRLSWCLAVGSSTCS